MLNIMFHWPYVFFVAFSDLLVSIFNDINFGVGVALIYLPQVAYFYMNAKISSCFSRGAFDSAKSHKRQHRKRQSVTAKRESQKRKVANAKVRIG